MPSSSKLFLTMKMTHLPHPIQLKKHHKPHATNMCQQSILLAHAGCFDHKHLVFTIVMCMQPKTRTSTLLYLSFLQVIPHQMQKCFLFFSFTQNSQPLICLRRTRRPFGGLRSKSVSHGAVVCHHRHCRFRSSFN